MWCNAQNRNASAKVGKNCNPLLATSKVQSTLSKFEAKMAGAWTFLPGFLR
jgi:hypothetical protein